MSADLCVVIPTLNERDNVKPLLAALGASLAGIAWEVVFVDDDSTDGTSELIRSIARRDQRVRCLRRIGRRGLASACIEGMESSTAPYLAVMLNDPYDVVRYIGARSLRTLRGYEGFRYDFIGGDDHYRNAVKRAMKVWKGQSGVARRSTGTQILIDVDGRLLDDEFARRLEQREDPPVILGE